MSERLMATRTGLAVALAYTLPLLLWLFWEAELSSLGQFDPAPSLQSMTKTGLMLQSCALAVCTPWLMRFTALIDRCGAIAMLLMVPGPLYAVAALTEAVSGASLLQAMLLLAVLALAVHLLYATLIGATAQGLARGLVLGCTQVVLVILCWQQRGLWQQVLSP